MYGNQPLAKKGDPRLDGEGPGAFLELGDLQKLWPVYLYTGWNVSYIMVHRLHVYVCVHTRVYIYIYIILYIIFYMCVCVMQYVHTLRIFIQI